MIACFNNNFFLKGCWGVGAILQNTARLANIYILWKHTTFAVSLCITFIAS